MGKALHRCALWSLYAAPASWTERRPFERLGATIRNGERTLPRVGWPGEAAAI